MFVIDIRILIWQISLCLMENTLTAKDHQDIRCFQEISAVSSHMLIKWSLRALHMPLFIIIMHHCVHLCALQCLTSPDACAWYCDTVAQESAAIACKMTHGRRLSGTVGSPLQVAHELLR